MCRTHRYRSGYSGYRLRLPVAPAISPQTLLLLRFPTIASTGACPGDSVFALVSVTRRKSADSPTRNSFADPQTTCAACSTSGVTAMSALSRSSCKPSPPALDRPSGDHRLQLCPTCDATSTASCPDCSQSFCCQHIYSCPECGDKLCGKCLDAHLADGHWSDSDTAAELAHAGHMTTTSASGQSGYRLSGASTHIPISPPPPVLTRFMALLARFLRPPAFVQPEPCL